MGSARILVGDVKVRLGEMADGSVDSIVTDPPYELGFMGKSWDSSGIANDVEMWRECLRVLKPGGYLLSFGGSRTYHRMACAIEDAGFEVRDQIMWLYGSGFPKSLDVSKAIDKAAGAEREVVRINTNGSGPNLTKLANHGEGDTGIGYMDGSGKTFNVTAPATDAAKQWAGWGTALKPAHEPICVARKPLAKGMTVAENVLAHGTGAINIDGCRITWPGGIPEIGTPAWGGPAKKLTAVPGQDGKTVDRNPPSRLGRWPANAINDGSEEVVSLFPKTQSGAMKAGTVRAAQDGPGSVCYGTYGGNATNADTYADKGSAARFFYTAKASRDERGDGNNHPTVKPVDLMRYLVRLVTPPGGLVVDCFMGSGTTGVAAFLEGFQFIGIELNPEYAALAERRIRSAAPLLNTVEVVGSKEGFQ